MFGVFKLGGEAFGCESTPPRPVKMKKGKGRNRWNAGGFKAAWNNGKGPIRITYNHRKGTITRQWRLTLHRGSHLLVHREDELALGEGHHHDPGNGEPFWPSPS